METRHTGCSYAMQALMAMACGLRSNVGVSYSIPYFHYKAEVLKTLFHSIINNTFQALSHKQPFYQISYQQFHVYKMSEQTMTMAEAEQKLLAEQVARLTKLPSPETPPELEPDTVRFFGDDNFGPNHFSLNIGDYTMDQRHRLYRDGQNKITWVSWNLPLGTVMTMTEFDKTLKASQIVADLADCGRCVDLVGTGKTEVVDLVTLDMNDCFKGFFWREVDLRLGAVEIFDATKEGLKGNKKWARQTIFLSEWAPGVVHGIGSWLMNDKISSARWNSLVDRQTVTLFEHADGSGDQYNNIKGWGTVKEEPDFHRLDHGDKFSSFSWKAINPVKEKIDPIILTPDHSNGFTLTSDQSGNNGGKQVLPVKLTITKANTEEITVETTDTTATSVGATLETTAKAGVEGGASYEVKWALSVEHSWGHTDNKSTKKTETTALSLEQTVNISPERSFEAHLIVRIGKVAEKLYKVKATRWYNQHLTGCVKDGKLYKRDETVILNISGSLHCKVSTEVKEGKLPKSMLDATIDKGQDLANSAVDKGQSVGKDAGKAAHNLLHKVGIPAGGEYDSPSWQR
jgi:hypothetical protein